MLNKETSALVTILFLMLQAHIINACLSVDSKPGVKTFINAGVYGGLSDVGRFFSTLAVWQK